MTEHTIAEALDMGVGYAEAGNFQGAATMFRGVLIHEPDNFEAIERLGSVLFETEQYHEAFYWFWRGREINKKHPLALTNWGLTLSQLGHPEKGLPDLERAAGIADHMSSLPVRALVWNNLGNTLERLGKYKAALHALDKGITNNPDDPFPHYNRGIVLIRLGRHAEAIKSLDRCLALQARKARPHPAEIADAHYNRGMAKLVLGDIKEGFAEYEYRLTTSENKDPNFGFPVEKKWNGGALGDTPLLVIGEQGLGDTIQFLRFVPEILRRAPKLTLAVHSAVAPLVKEQWPDIPILPAKTTIPHSDIGRWAALMSMPHLFGIEKESDIPPPWLPPIDRTRIERWSNELPPRSPHRLRIAVCWAGNFHHKNNGNRSIELDVFSRLFELDCDFVSVQQMNLGDEDVLRDLCAKQEHLRALRLDDLRDTAAVIANCDLTITVDTSVALFFCECWRAHMDIYSEIQHRLEMDA